MDVGQVYEQYVRPLSPSDRLRLAERIVAQAAAEATEAQSASRLFEIARRRLPPEAERRLRHLRTQQAEGEMSAEERAELLALVERVEQADAERAAAIVVLARLRGVPVSDVLQELSAERAADAD